VKWGSYLTKPIHEIETTSCGFAGIEYAADEMKNLQFL